VGGGDTRKNKKQAGGGVKNRGGIKRKNIKNSDDGGKCRGGGMMSVILTE